MRRREEEEAAAIIMALEEQGKMDTNGTGPNESMGSFLISILGFSFGLLYGISREIVKWAWNMGNMIYTVYKDRGNRN